jgi:predicted RND superfamily exporter protein
VFSLAAFAAQARASGGTLDTVAEDLPPPLAGRLISEDRTQAAISVLFPYVDSADTHARADALQAALAAEPAPEGVRFGTITGLTVMSADVSQGVLREFNMTFLVALVSAVGLMALWLRRPLVALVALVPNVLPIACAGAWLTLSGMGLEFASGLALTIAFGLAIDDTVHVLNRLRLSGGFDRLDDPAAVGAAVQGVAPALVITSLVLGLGMTGTLLASLTSLVVFGGLSMAVFVLALLADLLVLPACLIMLGRFRSRLARRCR